MKNEDGTSNYSIMIMVYSTLLLTISIFFYLVKDMVNELKQSSDTKRKNDKNKDN